MNTKALFIGPYGENKEEFQRLVQLLIEDVVGWRKNYHPNDPDAIQPGEMREESYCLAKDKLSASLNKLIAEMKQSVPIHSPRYLGHMLSDVLTPALLGYFTGLIFNQNNIVGEVSTVTTRKEMDFSKALCQMIGYNEYDINKDGSWGHLTGGGSIAILEGIWTARNMKYYPLSVKLLIKDIKDNADKYKPEEKEKLLLLNNIEVEQPNHTIATFQSLDLFTLFNLSNKAIADFKDAIASSLSASEIIDESKHDVELLSEEDKKNIKINEANDFLKKKIDKFLVQNLGVAGVHLKLNEVFNENLKLPKLFISQTAHYSWEKNIDILGIGKENVIKVKCDADFRLDMEDLKSKIKTHKDSAILMIAGVVGTTEESAIDPIHTLSLYKKELEETQNKSFFFKIDGAWGGYYLSMLKRNGDTPEITEFFNSNNEYINPIEEDLNTIKECDSIVIDPHKMGYVPYAVGAVCYKDTRYKDFIYKSAPYLASSNEQIFFEKSHLGGWTVEGSRSGAAALACALSADVLPLNRSGYGKINLQTIKRSYELYDYFIVRNVNSDIKILPVYKPQGNIVCYLIAAPKYIKKAEYLNLLNNIIFNEMAVMPDRNLPDFIPSKTELKYEKYKEKINDLISRAGCIKENLKDSFELTFLRTVTMNPMLESYKVEVRDGNYTKTRPIFDEFTNEIERISQKALIVILLKIIKQKRKDSKADKKEKRLKLFWIENKTSFESLQNLLKTDELKVSPTIGKYIDITFENYQGEEPIKRIKQTLKNHNFDFSIIDLNLTDSRHKEWQSGLNVISELYKNNNYNNAGIPIIFSQFLDEEKTANALKKQFKTQYPKVFTIDEQFLAKNKNSENELLGERIAIQELVKRIFILSQ